MALDYWYDGQLKRYWLQFTRIFGDFYYETGVGSSGTTSMKPFPVRMATKDRMIGVILRNNSENVAMSVPQVTTWMTDIRRAPERIQTPNHVSTINVLEREIDPVTRKYTSEMGKAYTVERMMAVPYDMTMQVDVWVSNEDQKNQFMEQVLTLFNPSIDLQTSTNPIDWTSLGIVSLDTIVWSNRSFPIGTDSDIEFATLTFQVPIWITPPAKVKRQNIINQIITNIGIMADADPNCVNDEINIDPNNMKAQMIVTPGNYRLDVAGNVLTLLSQNDNPETEENQKLSWVELLRMYGHFRPGISQIRIKTNDNMDDHTSDIVGTFTLDDTDPTKAFWSVDMDTLKPNTLQPINAIIDPQHSTPGINMPAPVEGVRYLLLDDIVPSSAWNFVAASTNDIVQYQNGQWVVVFDASLVTTPQFLVNSFSGKQYQWTSEFWREAVGGVYNPGYWRIYI